MVGRCYSVATIAMVKPAFRIYPLPTSAGCLISLMTNRLLALPTSNKLQGMAGDKIKVLFRHRSMEMGGVEKVLLSMLNHLNRDRFELSVGLNLNQGELRESFPKSIPVKTLARGREDFPKNRMLHKAALVLRGLKLFFYRKFPAFVDRFILKNDADVEIATSYTMYGDVLNSSNKKSKKIAWLHSDLSVEGWAPYREKIFGQLQRFDYIFYGSQQCFDVLKAQFPDLSLPPGRVVRNAIPIPELKEKARETEVDFQGKPTFVSVGRLHYRKGYRQLVEAHKLLWDRGFVHKVIVIGDGEDRELLEKRVQELGLGDSFKFLGTLLNPYPYVRNADFYIMPSETEGWPLIIAETLILQKPIIATAVGGVPEMISHKENGYLVNPNAEELAAAMEVFLTDRALIETIKGNLTQSEKQFDNAEIFRSVEEVLNDIVRK